MNSEPIYKVSFMNQGNVYEIYAVHTYPSDMFVFLCVEKILFDENSGVLVDPSEEKLKAEFKGVERTHIPIQAIIRVDEVDKQGTAKIKEVGEGANKVTAFPGSAFPVGNTPDFSNKE